MPNQTLSNEPTVGAHTVIGMSMTMGSGGEACGFMMRDRLHTLQYHLSTRLQHQSKISPYKNGYHTVLMRNGTKSECGADCINCASLNTPLT